MPDQRDLRGMGLLGKLIDGATQISSAARKSGAVIVGEAGTLLTMERQDLSQTPELAGGAEATMHQHIDRLTGIQVQTAIWTIGAGPEAGDGKGDVCGWQAARIDLKIGRVERFTRCTAAEQGQKCGERSASFYDRPRDERVCLQFRSLAPDCASQPIVPADRFGDG